MTTQEAVMSTKEIADRFYELAQGSNWKQIQDEMYSDSVESIEPAHAVGQGLENAKGREGLLKKMETFQAMVEEFHGGYTGKPIVAGHYFAVPMGMDVTMKGAGRVNMEEIAVYQVRDGKIVKEQFFY